MSVNVILNRRSRANRRNPEMADRLTSLLGGAGRVLAGDDLSELDRLTRAIAADPPAAIAIHGGDGTLHVTLSSLIRSFAGKPLPPVAILPGGTMNVVAASLGLGGRPEAILASLLASVREVGARGGGLRVVARHCLQVGEAYGFVFGAGLIANFLEEYYARDRYGSRRALWILGRTFLSGLIDGGYSKRIFRRVEGTILVDGRPLPFERLTGIGAATVREVGLGFKLNHRADDDPERFGYLAIHGGPVTLALDLAAVHRGDGIAPARAASGLGRTMRLEVAGGSCVYTVDGDLYRSNGPVDVNLGPRIRFYKWH